MAEEVAPELLLHIFATLSPKDSSRVCLTCKRWNTHWKDNTLWKRWHKQCLGGEPFPPLQRGDWRKSFKKDIKQLNSFSVVKDKLFFAIERNRHNIVLDLMTKNSFLTSVNKCPPKPGLGGGPYINALRAAATAGKLSMFRMLWEKVYFPERHESASDEEWAWKYRFDLTLQASVVHGNLAILQYLVEVSPYMRKHIRDFNSLLSDACKGKGDLNRITNTIEYLLQHGAELKHEQIRVALW